MAIEKEPWFVVDRSEALAGLLLTSREDIRVLDGRKSDSSVDFLVEVNTGEAVSTRLFVVQVKGTTSSDKAAWMAGVKELFLASSKSTYLPSCVFVVNVRDNRSVYAWLAEPLVEEEGPKLRFLANGEFHDLDQAAIDLIVERVKAWYNAIPHQVLPA